MAGTTGAKTNLIWHHMQIAHSILRFPIVAFACASLSLSLSLFLSLSHSLSAEAWAP